MNFGGLAEAEVAMGLRDQEDSAFLLVIAKQVGQNTVSQWAGQSDRLLEGTGGTIPQSQIGED